MQCEVFVKNREMSRCREDLHVYKHFGNRTLRLSRYHSLVSSSVEQANILRLANLLRVNRVVHGSSM